MRRVLAVVLCSTVATVSLPGGVFAASIADQSPQGAGTGSLQGVARNAQQQNLPSIRVHVRAADGKLVAVGTTNSAGE